MKNKKGFTLVELLAVIAILAILVIIALPNVIRMFTEAKKNSFITEAQTVYKEASSKFISELSKGHKLSTISSSDDTKLDMTGEGLDYCVILDNQGKVKKLAVGNNSYYVMIRDVNDIESITKDEVKDGKLEDMKCDSSAFKVKLKCKYDGNLKQGAEYVNGQYTYRYMQETTSNGWASINREGWGVTLTDKNSTEPVTTDLCTTINDKPIISMSYMFSYSKAKSIDLSSFDTSNVFNMSNMFQYSKVESIDLSSFDTSNVERMSWMFLKSNITNLDLSNFNTSRVTDMQSMFSSSKFITLNLENFNTSNVKNMSYMFGNMQIDALDLSSFNTSNVVNMYAMFWSSNIKSIVGLDNFNTLNVTNMALMFNGLQTTSLNVSKFNTSKVTDMSSMFSGSRATVLDLSNFDTSKVTNMNNMFCGCQAVKINGLENFDTSNVTDMNGMFYISQATMLDVAKFNTSKVTNMANMFAFSKTKSLDLSNFDTSKVTNMYGMFSNCSSLKTIYVSDKFITDNVTNSTSMFLYASNLVGGNGTKHNNSYIDKTYARIDGGTSSPGYFTLKQ